MPSKTSRPSQSAGNPLLTNDLCENPGLSEAPELSIILPAYNEAGNIEPMCSALASVLPSLARTELIFVDDGSSDGTLAALRLAAASNKSVRYISFSRNFGHQAALRAGLRYARGLATITMDADFEHPLEIIPELVTSWRDGFKVILTKRIEERGQVGATKQWTSDLFYRLMDATGDIRIAAGSSDFMLLDRCVVDIVNRTEDRNLFLRGFVRWLGFPTTTIPFVRGRRLRGASKFTPRRMVELAIDGISAHSIAPLRFAVWLAIGFAMSGCLFLVYAIVSFLFVRHTVAGWSSLMATIAILGATQLLVLGIIGEYVGRILRETSGRPSYVIAETENDGSSRREHLEGHSNRISEPESASTENRYAD